MFKNARGMRIEEEEVEEEEEEVKDDEHISTHLSLALVLQGDFYHDKLYNPQQRTHP